MVDHNEKLLQELLKKPGNNVCADCGSEGMSQCFISDLQGKAWYFYGVVNRRGGVSASMLGVQ